jgi:hypothetical protein
MNYKYLHVSKALVEIPVINPDGSVGPAKQIVAVKYGTTYRNPNKKWSRERERRHTFKTLGWTKKETDAFLRVG